MTATRAPHKPDGWLHLPTGNVLKDSAIKEMLPVWQRQFAETHTAGEIEADFAPLYRVPAPLSPAAVDVLAERHRQIQVEGWTPEHDDQHANGEMARAAAAYALGAERVTLKASDPFNPVREISTHIWPWDRKWWKPRGGVRRMLVKAAALLIAEIERIDRAGKGKGGAA